MKRKGLLTILFFVLMACERPSECVESAGAMITKEVAVSEFTRLEVYRGIEVVIKQGDAYQVQIQTGANLMGAISVAQTGTTLVLKDNTTCNWVREYGQTIVYITAPNLEEIYSKTDRNISSDGILNYANLKIKSVDKDGDGVDGAGTGDFYLHLNCSNLLDINNNNMSRYNLTGTVANFNLGIYNGDGRIEAQNLIAQHVFIYHRGSNDIFVHPMQSVSGQLVSTGNVILKNNPPTNTIYALYLGQVLYN